MSSSPTPKQVAKQALREKVKLEAQVKYLQSQVGQMLQEKRRNLRSSRSASKQADSDNSGEEESNSLGVSSEDAYERRSSSKAPHLASLLLSILMIYWCIDVEKKSISTLIPSLEYSSSRKALWKLEEMSPFLLTSHLLGICCFGPRNSC